MSDAMEVAEGEKRILTQFKNEDGVLVGTPFDLPLSVTQESLGVLCNAVLENVSASTPFCCRGWGLTPPPTLQMQRLRRVTLARFPLTGASPAPITITYQVV